MSTWPRYPTIYEINTWVWLAELSAKAERTGWPDNPSWQNVVA